VIDSVCPEATQLIETNAPERVEVILKRYTLNLPDNRQSTTDDGMIVHLVNLTGFSGNTYFEPLPVYNLSFRMPCDFKPSALFSMASGKTIPYTWKNGKLEFNLAQLGPYDGIVLRR